MGDTKSYYVPKIYWELVAEGLHTTLKPEEGEPVDEETAPRFPGSWGPDDSVYPAH
jgi:hypothetical protein